ncbi:MAG: 4-hydroxy-3-methylbut-2-enyl diphosphate reductase [Bacilli bacterium]|nr:4-hydroxy-3-methylbut-2-enyl diphosphate reductase [Bacilli bacterium]
MKITIGKTSGFCNGVENTVKRAENALGNEKVYCLGEIVHNERVIHDLEANGMITINKIEDAPNNSKVIIRAHGELKETYDKAKEKNIEILDLTCGKIKAIRVKISKKLDDHYIIIIGKKNHPESLGVLSFSGEHSNIIEDKEDINEIIDKVNNSLLNKIYIVSQTTFNSDKFDELISIIKNKTTKEVIVDKTICDATSKRQNETRELSKLVDTMIIVGGKKSSNTKELEIIAKENCDNVILIQEKNDLNNNQIVGEDIGIMAGASTPTIVVEEIIKELKQEK